MKMNKQQGFTLVELVIVIVLLGILAATVAPRFVGMQGAAHASVLQSAAGSLDSAAKMVYSKAVVDNKDGSIGTTMNIGGILMHIRYGFPRALNNTSQGIMAIVDDLDRFNRGLHSNFNGTADRLVFWPNGYSVTPNDLANSDQCYLYYSESVGGEEPEIKAVTSGC